MLIQPLQGLDIQRGVGEQPGLHHHCGTGGKMEMLVEQIGGGHGIDLQLERLAEVGLERQLERRHDRIGRLFISLPFDHHGAGGFGHQVEQPFRHFLVERRQHGEQLLLPALLQEGLQRINRRIRIPMVMTAGVDEMDQIARQRIGPTPIKHENLLRSLCVARSSFTDKRLSSQLFTINVERFTCNVHLLVPCCQSSGP